MARSRSLVTASAFPERVAGQPAPCVSASAASAATSRCNRRVRRRAAALLRLARAATLALRNSPLQPLQLARAPRGRPPAPATPASCRPGRATRVPVEILPLPGGVGELPLPPEPVPIAVDPALAAAARPSAEPRRSSRPVSTSAVSNRAFDEPLDHLVAAPARPPSPVLEFGTGDLPPGVGGVVPQVHQPQEHPPGDPPARPRVSSPYAASAVRRRRP